MKESDSIAPKCFWRKSTIEWSTYFHRKMMWTHVLVVILWILVYVRRKKLAPKFPDGVRFSGHVYRIALRIREAFKYIFIDVESWGSSYSRNIREMELVFYEYMLVRSLLYSWRCCRRKIWTPINTNKSIFHRFQVKLHIANLLKRNILMSL